MTKETKTKAELAAEEAKKAAEARAKKVTQLKDLKEKEADAHKAAVEAHKAVKALPADAAKEDADAAKKTYEQAKGKAIATREEYISARVEAAQGTVGKKAKYMPKIEERHLMHVKLEKPIFSQKNGERLSKPYTQKFTDAELRTFLAAKSSGYTLETLWDGSLYNAAE